MATEARPKLLTAEEFMVFDLGEGMHELVRGEIVEVAQGCTCKVAQLAVVTLGLELADHHNRKHDIVLVETPHCVRIAQQDGGVDDVCATAW